MAWLCCAGEWSPNTKSPTEQARGLFAENFRWHYSNDGLPDLNKTYHGLDGWLHFCKDLAAITGGTFSVGLKEIYPIGSELVAIHALPTMVIDGKAIETDAAVVWRIVDGKLAEACDIPGLISAIRLSAVGE